MAQVQVFEPWYVTLAESVKRVVPAPGTVARAGRRGRRGRGDFGVGTRHLGVHRLDLAVYAAQLGLTRLQATTVSTAGAAVSGMFGESALTAVRDGGVPAIAIGVGALLATCAAATLGLRRLLTASHRRQEK